MTTLTEFSDQWEMSTMCDGDDIIYHLHVEKHRQKNLVKS